MFSKKIFTSSFILFLTSAATVTASADENVDA